VIRHSTKINGLSTVARTERDPASSYRTPDWLVARFSLVLGGIELDPCTVASNPCGAETFYTPDDDGILQLWNAQRIYINPPYGKTIRHWVYKGLEVARSGAKVIMLVPGRTDARWFQEALLNAASALLFAGRLKFHSTLNGDETDAPFPSVALAYNCELESLRDLGTLIVAKKP
jgi:phage N-6-adenine-methyltransferase